MRWEYPIRLDDYQDVAASYCLSTAESMAYLALGLTGEAGEVAEKIKKSIRDGVLNEEEVAKELGDVLWYLSNLSLSIGYTLEEVAVLNIKKLEDRKKRNKLKGSGDNR